MFFIMRINKGLQLNYNAAKSRNNIHYSFTFSLEALFQSKILPID